MLESFLGCTRWTTSGCPFLTTQTLFVRLDDIPLIISCAGHVPRALSYICRTSDLFLYSYAGLEWRIGVNRYFPGYRSAKGDYLQKAHRRLSSGLVQYRWPCPGTRKRAVAHSRIECRCHRSISPCGCLAGMLYSLASFSGNLLR